jgi:anti-sigma factor RsiW
MIDDDPLLLHALADGELDAATSLALERRIAADPALSAEFDLIMALKDKVARLERPAITPELYTSIAALGSSPAAATLPVSQQRLAFFDRWRAIAASVVVTAFLASGATFFLEGRHAGFSMEDAVAGSHRRSLLAANPVDIASSDRHTVKPWLDSKLGISPPTTDLATMGYPLIGGRVDVLGSNTVPTLVYRHNEHLITVLAVPGSHSETQPTVELAGGYNMVRWTGGGFSFWAVSDLEPGELRAFVADYRSN